MSAPPHNYEFGDFSLDSVKRRLLPRDGDPVSLTPRVFDTLLYLVQNAGKVLENSSLRYAESRLLIHTLLSLVDSYDVTDD